MRLSRHLKWRLVRMDLSWVSHRVNKQDTNYAVLKQIFVHLLN